MVNTDNEPTKTPNPKPEAVQRIHQGCPFKWLSIVLTLLALIAAIYAMVLNYQTQQSLGYQSIELQKQFAQVQKKNQEDLHASQALEANLTAVQNHINTLDKTMNSILPQRLYQQQDWLLLKVRYFLELAQVNAHWTDDKETTIALLQQASELLSTLSNEQSFKIRQSIANEIATLNALPLIDRAGLLSQLDAAKNSIATLPIKHIAISQTEGTKPSALNTKQSYWNTTMQQTTNLLEKLVIIRHNEAPIQPLLSPMHELLIRDSLKMDLQQAQWAILQKSIPVYQLSLTQALTNLHQYFDTDAPATKALIKSLDALQGEVIQHKQPAIERSLQMVTEWIDANNSTLNPVSTQGENKP